MLKMLKIAVAPLQELSNTMSTPSPTPRPQYAEMPPHTNRGIPPHPALFLKGQYAFLGRLWQFAIRGDNLTNILLGAKKQEGNEQNLLESSEHNRVIHIFLSHNFIGGRGLQYDSR